MMILGILILVLIIALLWNCFQLLRNQEIYDIRMRWLREDKGIKCLQSISYDYMMMPNSKNWFGLKWPKEKDYIQRENK